ncbi:MAG TPA: hypothetical protein VFX44_11490 [Solirubrobacterales bacterium]|nr:hypothetical protein [Solirubrobacterales bacterium]
MRRWFRNLGFPILVLAALVASGYLAATARDPDPVPSFALQAAAVYRLEVGGACFAAFYLAAMALALALDGRGFAELGTRGLRAAEVVRSTNEQEVSLSEQTKLNLEMEEKLDETNAALEDTVQAMREQEERLAVLEEER